MKHDDMWCSVHIYCSRRWYIYQVAFKTGRMKRWHAWALVVNPTTRKVEKDRISLVYTGRYWRKA